MNSHLNISFESLFVWSGTLLLMSGCFNELRTEHLQIPPGAVTDISAKNSEDYAAFSHALKRAHDQKNPPSREVEVARKNSEALLEAVKTSAVSHGAATADIASLETGLHTAKGLDSSEDLADRVMVIAELQGLLRTKGPMATIRQAVAATSADKALWTTFEENFHKRLLLEILQIRELVMGAVRRETASRLPEVMDLQEAANVNTATEKLIASLHGFLTALNKASDQGDITTKSARYIHLLLKKTQSSIDILAATASDGKKDVARFNSAFAKLDSFSKTALTTLISQFATLAGALLTLNPSQNPHLQDVVEPLAVGAANDIHQKKTAVQQIEDQLSGPGRPLVISLPDEREMPFIEEYLSLKNFKVITVDLEVMAKYAHALSLDHETFIAWVVATINKLDQSRLVFLHGLGGLNFDRTINDETSQKAAAANNLLSLLNLCADRRVLVPITKAHQLLFGNVDFSRQQLIELAPYHLSWAQKIIEAAVDRLNARGDVGERMQAEQLISLAKISRALKPALFFVFTMDGIFKQLKGKKQDRQAVLEAASILFDPERVNNSGVLTLSPALVEKKLREDVFAFTKSPNNEALLKAIADGKSTQQELEQLLIHLKVEEEAFGKRVEGLRLKIDGLVRDGKHDVARRLVAQKAKLDKLMRDQDLAADELTKKKLTELEKKLADAVKVAEEKVKKEIKQLSDDAALRAQEYLDKVKLALEEAEKTIKSMSATGKKAKKSIKEFKKMMAGFETVKAWKKETDKVIRAQEHMIADLVIDLADAKKSFEDRAKATEIGMNASLGVLRADVKQKAIEVAAEIKVIKKNTRAVKKTAQTAGAEMENVSAAIINLLDVKVFGKQVFSDEQQKDVKRAFGMPVGS